MQSRNGVPQSHCEIESQTDGVTGKALPRSEYIAIKLWILKIGDIRTTASGVTDKESHALI